MIQNQRVPNLTPRIGVPSFLKTAIIHPIAVSPGSRTNQRS